jgi:hypothetical protein
LPWRGTEGGRAGRWRAHAEPGRRTRAAPGHGRCRPWARCARQLGSLVLGVGEADGLLLIVKRDVDGPSSSTARQNECVIDLEFGTEKRLVGAETAGLADDDADGLAAQGAVPQGGAAEDQRRDVAVRTPCTIRPTRSLRIIVLVTAPARDRTEARPAESDGRMCGSFRYGSAFEAAHRPDDRAAIVGPTLGTVAPANARQAYGSPIAAAMIRRAEAADVPIAGCSGRYPRAAPATDDARPKRMRPGGHPPLLRNLVDPPCRAVSPPPPRGRRWGQRCSRPGPGAGASESPPPSAVGPQSGSGAPPSSPSIRRRMSS